MQGEPIPERLVIETDALAVRAPRPLSGMLGLGAVALFLLPMVIMMVGGGVFGMDKPAAWPEILGTSWIGGMIVGALGGAIRAAEMSRKGSVEVVEGRLSLLIGSKRESFPDGAVLGGSVTPQIGGALLTLGLADGRVASAFVPSEAAGARALQALRIDPMGRALVARFRGGFARSAAGFGVGFALILLGGWLKNVAGLSPAMGLAWTVSCLAFVAAWLVGTRPPEIAVGADGVRIRGKLGTRFIPLARIESVKVDDLNTLELTLRGGTVDRTRIALGNGPMLAAIAHRIQAAMDKTRAGETGDALLAILGRGARSVGAWREELRKKVQQADYRHASIEGGELERLVGSAGASAEQRIGAALALREAGAVDARGRIRIAADQCVDPRIRIALQTIAGDAEVEDRAVEEALDSAAAARTTRKGEAPDP